jgi:hypothetical protein
MAAAVAYTRAPPGAASQPETKSAPGVDLAALRAEAQAADDALAGLVGTFGTLAACRSDVLTPTEIRTAHGALDVAGAAENRLAAQLAKQQGGQVLPVRPEGTVVAATLAREQPYVATDAGEIYDRPDAKGRKIAALRKGQRLTSPSLAAAAKPGWLAIDLNDGSTGYVVQDIVRPLAARPATTTGTGNPSTMVVAIDLITEALPEKRAALQARLAASEAAIRGGT